METVPSLGDIRVYDENLRLLQILPQFASADWQLHHRMWGTAEFHLPKEKEIVRLFTEHTNLFLSQGALQAVVTGVRIEKDVTVFCRTPEWLLTRFMVPTYTIPYKAKEKPAGYVACLMVRTFLPDVPLQTEGEEIESGTPQEMLITKACDLHTALLTCLPEENTGFTFRFLPEEQTFLFTVYNGKERECAALSVDMKTAYDMVYTRDIQNRAEGGVYYHRVIHCGKWDPVYNLPRLSNTRRFFGECYTASEDCENTELGFSVLKGDKILCNHKDGTFEVVESTEPFAVEIPNTQTGIFAWSTLLSSDTEADAQTELASCRTEQNLTGRTTHLLWGREYHLGDVIAAELSTEGFVHREKRRMKSVHLWENGQSRGELPETCAVEENAVEENAVSAAAYMTETQGSSEDPQMGEMPQTEETEYVKEASVVVEGQACPSADAGAIYL